MGLGLAAAAGVFGYIAYMRHKYEGLGYYVAVQDDGREQFLKKKSNWETWTVYYLYFLLEIIYYCVAQFGTWVYWV